jgi:hypothetical protein
MFTPDQLAMLHTALSPPMPALHTSPQMGPPAPCAPAPAAPPRGPVPLAAVGVGYGLAAAGVAAAGLAAPGRHLDAVLLASPALALALGLHALATPSAPLAAPLGLLCALGTPWACYAPQPWGLWAAALGLAAFFPATLPPGPGRWCALGGILGVLLAGSSSPPAGRPAPRGAPRSRPWPSRRPPPCCGCPAAPCASASSSPGARSARGAEVPRRIKKRGLHQTEGRPAAPP